MRDAKTIVNTVKKQISKPVEVDRNKTAPQCRNCAYYPPEFKYRIMKSIFYSAEYSNLIKDNPESATIYFRYARSVCRS